MGEHLLDAQGVVRSIRTGPTITKKPDFYPVFNFLNLQMFYKLSNMLFPNDPGDIMICIQKISRTYNNSIIKGGDIMTETFKIGATKHIVPIYERISKDAMVLKEHGIEVDLTLGKDCGYQLLDCEVKLKDTPSGAINEDGLTIFCHQISEAVAETIVVWWKPDLVNMIINEKYRNLSTSEVDIILRKLFHASLGKSFYINSVTAALTWKKEIASRVFDFLEAGNTITVDGFINFRLQDFRLELDQLVEEAVEEYLLEKEYDDFISLLRYFVDTQEPRLEKVHVMLASSGAFNMYDQNYKLIDNDFLEGFILDLMDNDLSYEDLLVSALITIAPKEIVLHLLGPVGEMESAISTIQSVFQERVTMCIGCAKCLNFNIKS